MAPLSRGEKRRESARKGQKNAMKGRRCPSCGRGNALKRDKPPETPGWVGRHCRYCDYATGRWI